MGRSPTAGVAGGGARRPGGRYHRSRCPPGGGPRRLPRLSSLLPVRQLRGACPGRPRLPQWSTGIDLPRIATSVQARPGRTRPDAAAWGVLPIHKRVGRVVHVGRLPDPSADRDIGCGHRSGGPQRRLVSDLRSGAPPRHPGPRVHRLLRLWMDRRDATRLHDSWMQEHRTSGIHASWEQLRAGGDRPVAVRVPGQSSQRDGGRTCTCICDQCTCGALKMGRDGRE